MFQKRILIVDDEPSITSALSTLLKQAGFLVSVAHTGIDGLQKLSIKPDLVLLDVMLPDIHGHEVCQEIRQLLPATPILMLTALDGTQDKVAGLDTGADAYFTKPYKPAELLAQMRALLRRAERGAVQEGGALSCGPFQLWDAEHRVELNGLELELTPKEYELLHTLLQHPGVVLGRETLLREVWGYAYTGDTRTVDVHIQRLRTKIEADPANPRYLVTVRGFGYRLLPEPKG